MGIQTVVLVNYLKHLFSEPVPDVCFNGLQVEGGTRSSKIGFAVTASEAVIQEARQQKCDTLIVHHGLFWKGGVEKITGSLKRKVQLLLDAQINLFAYHLPLDIHQIVGNNWPVAKLLGLRNLEPFGEFLGTSPGVIGTFTTPISANLLAADLKKIYSIHGEIPFACCDPRLEITRVAICSGGAHKELQQAIAQGAQAFITGTRDEPQWHMAIEEQVAFFPVGHHISERIGPKCLLENLEGEFGKQIQTCWIENSTPY